MLKNRIISSFFIFLFIFISLNNNFFFNFFFIHLICFFILWEFFRLYNFRNLQSSVDTRDQVLNNFFLTRIKLSIFDYAHILFIQILLISYNNFEFIFIYMLTGYFLYLVFNIKKNIYQFFGVIYLSLPFFGFLYFQKIDQLITNFVLIFIITVSTDVGGFFMGKLLKGPKILKKISPKKTWSGFVGAILLSVVISELFYENIFGNFKACILVCLFSFVCQVGDFIESYFKRLCNVKESSNLIPGHGGILDRLDGAILLTTFITLFSIFQINLVESFVND